MKVILIQDVKKLGKKGDILEVAEGYARNFLLPQKLATAATNTNLNQIQQQKTAEADRARRQLDEARLLAAQIAKITVTVTAKAGEGGRLFGAVTTKDIADAMKAQHKLEIDRRKIEINDPIKNLGPHTASLKLHPEISVDLQLNITGE